MSNVLIVDNSALFRTLLKTGLERIPNIFVVGQASNMQEAVHLVTRLEPDIVLLDVNMPGEDGPQMIKKILDHYTVPILIVSNLQRDSSIYRLLAAGAKDVIAKPGRTTAEAIQPIAERVKNLVMSQPQMHHHHQESKSVAMVNTGTPGANSQHEPVIILVSSAGGPQTLAQILADLPADLQAAVLIVQHITTGFGQGLVQWLNGISSMPVRLAESNQIISPGTVLVAPDNAHLLVLANRRLRLDRTTAPVGSLRPAADMTLDSAAKVYKDDLLAIVLTGMGRDGEAGVQAVKACGGRVIVQDQASSVVYGMPQAARPFADAELPLTEIVPAINRFVYERLSRS